MSISKIVNGVTTGAQGRDSINSLVDYANNRRPSSIWASLPRLAKAIATQNDDSPSPMRVISLGSSVGRGSGTDAPGLTGAPGAVLTNRLNDTFDLLGNLSFVHTEGSVNGHAMSNALSDYATAKTSAGGAPILVAVFMGMNDGGGAQYHTGQTLPGIKTQMLKLIKEVQLDGADIVFYTSPHPNTSTYDFTFGGPYTYPGSYIPDGTAAKLTEDWVGNGDPFPQSYRHYRVNQMMRYVAAESGCLVVDAERFWFEAVSSLGNDALYNAVETVHPNTTGHEQSYGLATDDLVKTLMLSPITPAWRLNKTISQRTISTVSNGTVDISIPADSFGKLTIWGTAGGGWKSIWEGSVVSTSSAVSISEIAKAYIAQGNIVSSVAGSASDLDLTVTISNTISNGNISWKYVYDDFSA